MSTLQPDLTHFFLFLKLLRAAVNWNRQTLKDLHNFPNQIFTKFRLVEWADWSGGRKHPVIEEEGEFILNYILLAAEAVAAERCTKINLFS
jgi:hypothetical protein